MKVHRVPAALPQGLEAITDPAQEGRLQVLLVDGLHEGVVRVDGGGEGRARKRDAVTRTRPMRGGGQLLRPAREWDRRCRPLHRGRLR